MRIFLALLLSASSLFAQADYSTLLLLQNPSSAPSYIIEENFEDPSVSNSWTRFGTQTWFYDTAPAPLQGTNSINFSGSNAEAFTNFVGQSTVYWHERVILTDPLQSQYHFALRSNTTAMVQIRFTTAGAIQINHNTITTNSNNGLITSNTLYYIWGAFTKGDIGASNSSGWIKYSTTPTKPATNAVTIIHGAASNQVNRMAVIGWSGNNYIHDRVILDDEDIASNP